PTRSPPARHSREAPPERRNEGPCTGPAADAFGATGATQLPPAVPWGSSPARPRLWRATAACTREATSDVSSGPIGQSLPPLLTLARPHFRTKNARTAARTVLRGNSRPLP